MLGDKRHDKRLTANLMIFDPCWVQEVPAVIITTAAAGQLELPHTMQQQLQPAHNGVLPVAQHTQAAQAAQAALAPYLQQLQHAPRGGHINEGTIHSQHPVTAVIDAAAEWVDQSLEDGALLPGHSGGARSHLAAASEGDAEAWEWLQAANVAGVAARRLQQDTSSVTSTLLQVSLSEVALTHDPDSSMNLCAPSISAMSSPCTFLLVLHMEKTSPQPRARHLETARCAARLVLAGLVQGGEGEGRRGGECLTLRAMFHS